MTERRLSLSPPSPARGQDSRYARAVECLFLLFSATRWLTYLPTLWAIHASGDSSQHSLWTWATWMGSNLTMAAWLHQHHGAAASRAIVASAGNALMCGATLALIAWYR